jgi:uncharacterized small protein (DUF1192 family)
MITDDDTDPLTRKAKPRDLSRFSVPELQTYVTDLKAEIARAEADMAKKESRLAAADALFGKKGAP